MLQAVRSVVEPLLLFVWRLVTAPVRLPWRAVKRLSRSVVRIRQARQRQREELAAAEREREREQVAARERAEALAMAGKILDVD